MYIFTECSCFWKPKTRRFLTNCSNAELTSVPDNIPPNTTHLLLNDNSLYQLRNNSFEKLTKLQWLDVSNCQIYKIEVNAFLGLRNLQILSLEGNDLNKENNSYTPGVFSALAEKLTFLDISGNLKNKGPVSYPVEALSVLNSFKTLRIDCISGLKLDRGFGNLTKLKELDFSGGIQADILPDDMFSSISKLDVRTVNFSSVNVVEASGQVFSAVKSLRVLDFTNNPRVGESVIQITLTLDQTSIEELYPENTCLGLRTPDQNLIINEILVNLQTTKIRILSLDRNYIHEMKSVFHYIHAIEKLTVTNNSLYDYDSFFYDYLSAVNLTKLDISFQYLRPEPSSCPTLSMHQNIEPFHDVTKHTDFYDFWSNKKAWPFKWPKKLEWIALSNVNGLTMKEVPEIALLNNGSLKYADVSGNEFETFPHPLYCREKPHVISTIEYVDASNCGIKCAIKDGFKHCEYQVKFVNFSHNKLGLLEGGCNNDPMDTWLSIRPLITLEIFDLSYNSIDQLSNDTFDTLINLRKLFLSNNKLSRWKPNLINSVQLEYLDFSYNNFQTLPLDTRLMLNELDKNHFKNTSKHFSINLLANELTCFCENIQFLKWMTRTKINFIYLEQYTCQFSDTTMVQLSHNLNDIIAELESECSSNIWFICSIAALGIHFTLVTLTTVLFRYRHFLKYLILKMRMRRERLNAVLGINNEYQFIIIIIIIIIMVYSHKFVQ